MTFWPEFTVKRLLFSFYFAFLILASIGFAQSNPTSSATKKTLSIESIFADGSLTGRAPETLKWSPDGKMLSYVQRDDSGDHGELWYVDTSTGEKKVLVTDSTAVVSYQPVERSELKPGAPIFAVTAKQPDGSLTAARVNVGLKGQVPPM